MPFISFQLDENVSENHFKFTVLCKKFKMPFLSRLILASKKDKRSRRKKKKKKQESKICVIIRNCQKEKGTKQRRENTLSTSLLNSLIQSCPQLQAAGNQGEAMQSWALHKWWSRAGHGPSRASCVAGRFFHDPEAAPQGTPNRY